MTSHRHLPPPYLSSPADPVVALEVSDIDSVKCFIHVRNGKGGHERLVFLPPTLLEALRSYYRQIYPKPESWLFYGANPSQKLKAATLRHAFNQARDLAGISEDFTFHGLRHYLDCNPSVRTRCKPRCGAGLARSQVSRKHAGLYPYDRFDDP